MGIIKRRVRVSNGNGGEMRTVEVLIDTGATFSVLPDSLLKKIGIEARRRETFTFANGDTRRLPVGNAYFSVAGKEAFSPVVFGPDEEQFLLGATSLQSLGLIADTTHHTLIPAPKLPL